MFRKRVIAYLAIAGIAAIATPAGATPISVDTWYEFRFDGTGTPLATGVGATPGTNAPDGHPIVQVGDAPWTINLAAPGQLIVLDAFDSIDQFEIFDNLASIGSTSVPIDGGVCDGDITCALNDLNYSRAVFSLGIGDHSFTGTQLTGIPGAGFFQVTELTAAPEPGTLSLIGFGMAGLYWARRRKGKEKARHD